MGVLAGMAAGAAGTAALNLTTYLDMAIRGRPSSKVPAEVAEKLAQGAGVDLGRGSPQPQRAAQSRKSALGQLLGYAAGVGVGAAYGVLRDRGAPPLPLAGVALGAAAMAGSDVPATALRVTDPRKWGASAWASDIVPHLVYGFVTAGTYEALGNGA